MKTKDRILAMLELRQPMSQYQLADALNLSVWTVARTLTTLRQMGLIRSYRDYYNPPHWRALYEIAPDSERTSHDN